MIIVSRHLSEKCITAWSHLKHIPTVYHVLFICLALLRDLRMCHCGQGTSRIFGPNAISPSQESQENGALLFASILMT